MTPRQKRQRAIADPAYFRRLCDQIKSSLPTCARIALGDAVISIPECNDDDWLIVLTLEDSWILTEALAHEFGQVADALASEFDISEIGIYCKRKYWAAHLNPRTGAWLVLSEDEFHEIEGEIATIVPEDPDRPCCIGWNCDWKDDCCKHLEYQKRYKAGTLATAKTIEVDPEDCDQFESAICIDFTDIA